MSDIKPYPVDYKEKAQFGFFWLYLALVGFVLYYGSEMISYVIFFKTNKNPPHEHAWRLIDAGIYALSFVFISFQMVSFGVNFRNYENRVKARRTFIASLILSALIYLYEYLLVNMPIEQRKQSDYTVLFLSFLIIHYYVGINLKKLINIIGREKGVKTGTSIFYVLFALNPVIRNLMQFVLFIFVSLIINPYGYIFYANLVMTYISTAIALITVVFIILDVRKIKIAQLLAVLEEEQEKLLHQEAASSSTKAMSH